MNLTTLKQKHDDYNAKLKARGVKMLAYTVPCCNGQMEGRAAGAGEKWDSLATCPHCGELYMQITTANEIQALQLGSADNPPPPATTGAAA